MLNKTKAMLILIMCSMSLGQSRHITGPLKRFNVQDPKYGALGDGITNDDAAIQLAIDAATGAGGGIIYFPYATYDVAAQMDIDGPDIIFQGNGSTITIDASFDTGGPSTFVVFDVGALGDRVIFDGLNVNSLYAGGLGGLTVLAVFHYQSGSTDGTVRDCIITDAPHPNSGAIFFRSGSKRHTAINCKVIGTDWTNGAGGGIVASGANCIITSCMAVNLKDTNFALDGADGGIISNCISINDHLDGANLLAVGSYYHIFASTRCLITNNVLMGMNGVGIYLYSNAPETYDIKGNIVQGNVIHTGEYTVDGTSPVGIKLDSSVNGAIVANNSYYSDLTGAANDWGMDITTRNHKVSGNKIVIPAAGVGLFVTTSAAGYNGNLTIRNNSFDAGTGVRFRSGDNEDGIVIMSNNFYDVATYGINRFTGRPHNMLLYIDDEIFDTVTTEMYVTRIGAYFSAQNSGLYPHSIRNIATLYGAVSPATAGDTWELGDTIHDPTPVAEATAGWKCVTEGTISAATDATGDTNGSSGVITGMADTSDFFPGEYITTSAGFASSVDAGNTPVKIISIDSATQITINENSDTAESDITVLTPAPVFKAMANLAA